MSEEEFKNLSIKKELINILIVLVIILLGIFILFFLDLRWQILEKISNFLIK